VSTETICNIADTQVHDLSNAAFYTGDANLIERELFNDLCCNFVVDIPRAEPRELCQKTLDDADLETLKEAIEDLYYFEFVAGECFVGPSGAESIYIHM